jgi:hypothetical protein
VHRRLLLHVTVQSLQSRPQLLALSRNCRRLLLLLCGGSLLPFGLLPQLLGSILCLSLLLLLLLLLLLAGAQLTEAANDQGPAMGVVSTLLQQLAPHIRGRAGGLQAQQQRQQGSDSSGRGMGNSSGSRVQAMAARE